MSRAASTRDALTLLTATVQDTPDPRVVTRPDAQHAFAASDVSPLAWPELASLLTNVPFYAALAQACQDFSCNQSSVGVVTTAGIVPGMHAPSVHVDLDKSVSMATRVHIFDAVKAIAHPKMRSHRWTSIVKALADEVCARCALITFLAFRRTPPLLPRFRSAPAFPLCPAFI